MPVSVRFDSSCELDLSSYQAYFTLLRFCLHQFLWHPSFAPFLYNITCVFLSVFVQKLRENTRFCPFTLICLITKTRWKGSVFVPTHCSIFWTKCCCCCSVSITSVFVCSHIDPVCFKTFVFVRISVNTFTKTHVFLCSFVFSVALPVQLIYPSAPRG